jgi:hypothetical protein
MTNSDRKLERAIAARLKRIEGALIEAGIAEATREQKLEVLVRLLMNRRLNLVEKNLSEWPDNRGILFYGLVLE